MPRVLIGLSILEYSRPMEMRRLGRGAIRKLLAPSILNTDTGRFNNREDHKVLVLPCKPLS